MTADRRPVGLFVAAAVPGLLHAAASLYWGLGGVWLLDTVGQGAIALRRDSPLVATAVLLPVGLLKLAGAVVPILNQQGRLPWPRLWRALSWAGALLLVLYGIGYTVLAAISLSGGFGPVEDVTGLRGHAFLWDPLFATWGILLTAALVRSRRKSARQTGAR